MVYDGILENTNSNQDTISYKIKQGADKNSCTSDVTSNTTKIIEFPKLDAAISKSTWIKPTNFKTSNTSTNNSKYVAGVYTDQITFVVKLTNDIPK